MFKVALIGLDGQTVPTWVSDTFEKEGIEFIAQQCTSREMLAQVAGDADVVWVLGSHQSLYAENLDVIPKCSAIIRTGSGTDNVPVKEATARGILVANTPDALTDAVSDHAIGLLFSVIRTIPVQDRAMRSGTWDRHVAKNRWHLHGQTLGLIGFGRIAQAVARKLRGFQLHFIAYDPYVSAAVMAEQNVQAATLDHVLQQADFVSVHCPLTPETHYLIDERALRQMKPHAVLINTSRGAVIDESALIRALTDGWIAAAGLDVLEQEPPRPDNPLLKLDNIVLTPHIAAYSDEYFNEAWRLSVETAIALSRGQFPRSYVNHDVKPKWGLV
ncbi:MAG TPA: C-terminal binding protein [Anaerolineae bacterium]|nr:C-terminal binding protein [Anaerolineae bacterium]